MAHYIAPENLLARVREKIKLKLGLTDSSQLKTYIYQYVQKQYADDDGMKIANRTTSFSNQFNDKKMTIKTFFKFLAVIRVKRVKIIFEITDSKDRKHQFVEEVKINDGN